MKTIIIDIILVFALLFIGDVIFDENIQKQSIQHQVDDFDESVETEIVESINYYDSNQENIIATIIHQISHFCITIIEIIVIFVVHLIALLI